MWEGYMDYAGTEIINNERVVSYAANAGLILQCEPCLGIHESIGDTEYFSPDQGGNEAPWYDAALPESALFFGVLGMELAGFAVNPIDRTTDALVSDGSLLGVLRRTHREMGFTVMLVARNDCGMSYGMEWLAAALRGGSCDTFSCLGDQLCMFSCCPSTEDIDPVNRGCLLDQRSANTTVTREENNQLEDVDTLPNTDKLRHLYEVGILEGPEMEEKTVLPGGWVMAQVRFVMAASRPYIFRPPLYTGSDWQDLSLGQLYGPVDVDEAYLRCPEFTPCLNDPTCPPPPLPPRPPIPGNPCYKGGPGTYRRTIVSITPGSPPQWLETVPVLELSTGNRDLRRLIIRFWSNTLERPCSQVVNDPCEACFDININYLPAGASLVIDGRTQRASVGCPQGRRGFVYSTPAIYGTRGDRFDWPVFQCPTGLCVEFLTDAATTDASARARVLLYPRSDAA